MLGAAVVAVLAAGLAAGVRTTYGGHAAVDEPQYLLTALSLWEDRSLDISDELAQERWRPFHEAQLPVQTKVLDGGRQVSPHDPLLPLLLAVPMGLGGFVAAKLFLAVLAGAIAALGVWVAVRRFGVPARLAGTGVAVAFASPPLAIYGSQVYPEMSAAGAVLVAVAAATGALGRRGRVLALLAVTALPWLSVKYAPVAAAPAAVVLWRLHRDGRRRDALVLGGSWALLGLAYLGLHRMWWGGWTVYASGDHFTRTGELGVMGSSPDLAGRSLRLVALLIDRGYGIAAWAPVWLLAVVALAALLRRRPPGAGALLLPLAAGWAVATWLAFTMHGFWWPGRQIVVVLPLALIAILWTLAHVGGRALRATAGVLAGAGLLTSGALLVGGWARELTWVSGFQSVDAPLYAWARVLLPDYRDPGTGMWVRHAIWLALLTGLAVLGWHQARCRPSGAEPGAGPPAFASSTSSSVPDVPGPTHQLTSA